MIEHVNFYMLFDGLMGGSLPNRAMPLHLDFTLPIRLAALVDGSDNFLNDGGEVQLLVTHCRKEQDRLCYVTLRFPWQARRLY